MLGDTGQRLWLLSHTARRFGGDPLDPNGVGMVSVLPQFFGDGEQPDALAAIRGWTGTLFTALDQQDAQIAAGRLAAMDVPVTLIFGARDPYLGPSLGRHLGKLFRNAEIHLVDDASHWPQWDNPEAAARLIKQLPT